MDVSVVVGTYGHPKWRRLAERAVASAAAQVEAVIHVHGPTLHEARNEGASRAHTERLVFLDADDELEPGYVEKLDAGTCDLRAPSVRFVRPQWPERLWMPQVAGHRHACEAACLRDGNWLVIGTMIPRALFLEVGGFHDWPVYEDYDLFLRCWLAGATVEAIPGAVYRAHVRPDSRNRGAMSAAEKHRTHQAIARANRVPVPA